MGKVTNFRKRLTLTWVRNRWLYFGPGAKGTQGIEFLEFLAAEPDTIYPNKPRIVLPKDIKRQIDEYKSKRNVNRRRLVEIGYYAFIGLNMFLVCCLAIGVCCICRQGDSSRHR